MESPIHSAPAHPFTFLERYLVRREAQWVARRTRLSQRECRDIEQELISRYVAKQSSFDPARGEHTAFFRVVIRRLASNYAREAKAQKRGFRTMRTYSSGDMNELAEHIDQPSPGCGRSPHDQVALENDLAQVISTLPAGLQSLAERLKHHALMEVSRELGIAHTTLSAWVRKIRERFEAAGLREYL